MTFSDQIKELKHVLNQSRIMLTGDTDSIVNAFEIRIMELESDLDNAREDLELEKALTKKLKGLLDGGLVDLVGELVKVLVVVEDYRNIHHTYQVGKDSNLRGEIAYVLTKAKESMP